MRIKSQRLSLTRREARVNIFASTRLCAWVSLPVKVEGSTDSIALYPDKSDDGREILTGVEVTPDGYVKVKVNFLGTFTLVTP